MIAIGWMKPLVSAPTMSAVLLRLRYWNASPEAQVPAIAAHGDRCAETGMLDTVEQARLRRARCAR